MNINHELLQFYVYKKLVKRKDSPEILEECERLNIGVRDYLLAKEPASLKICTLLDKPERRREGVTVKCDYTGFVIPNEFVVGYGLDFNEHYRNLPFVGVLKPEAYQK